jgi:lipid II:glycine glycyltransferase (peptidoglycan interpeptide bridge formation enzyme)
MKSLITSSWNCYLELIPNDRKDIYFTEEYTNLYVDDGHKTALCYVCFEDATVLLMPFIRGDIDGIVYDFETPYGYGGPITNSDDKLWIISALKEMYCLFTRENYVAGLIRFHPLLDNKALCADVLQVTFERQTVFINLSNSIENIWEEQLSSKCRNKIRRAEKEGVVFSTDFTFDNVESFIRIYNDTMKRLNADTSYYFSKKYYDAFENKLAKNVFLGILKKDDAIIAASMVMLYNEYAHYHLSCSDPAVEIPGIINYLLWNVVKILKNKNIKKFHLGGGTNSDPENSLLKFKKSFSNNTGDFYISRLIFNNEKYNSLCREWTLHNSEKIALYKNYLLKYRY